MLFRSQFLTALLLALPLVSADGPVAIEVVGELISKPYIEITLNLLQRFGIAVQRDGWQRFTIPQGSAYRSPGSIHVEGDASSASYFVALGAIAGADAPVRIDTVTRPVIELSGPEAVGTFIGEAIARFEFFEFVILNAVVTIDGDHATGRIFMCELRQDRETGQFSRAFGRYDDTYVRAGDRW